MKHKLCDINPLATDALPALYGRQVGNRRAPYVDAFLKPMNATLPDGVGV